jgi:DNA-3-methyladenine glycosylase II
MQEVSEMPPRAKSTARSIAADADIRDGINALRRTCARIRHMHDLAGDPPLRRREAGFEGLARIVVAQQVSVASANAIWGRFAALVQPMDAPVVLAKTDDELRGAGLSRPKVRTLRAISIAVVHDGLTLANFDSASDEAVHDVLTRISGIGPWTADVFLLFCLGRADAFAAGDLALQEAARIAFELEARPNAAELLEIAERWRPWRGVAARMLWGYYKAVKERDGVTY